MSSVVCHVHSVCKLGENTKSTPAADNSCPHEELLPVCDHRQILRSTAKHCRPNPLLRMGWSPWGGRQPGLVHAYCVTCLAPVRQPSPIRYPKDKGVRRFPE